MKLTTYDLVLCALCAAVTCILAPLSVPLAGEVPVSLATFAVLLSGILLGAKLGGLSQLIYVLLGSVGVPVFAGWTGGIGITLGVTGGYIIGFIFMSLVYWIMESLLGEKTAVRIAALVIGLVVCYAFGTAWFLFVYARTSGAIGLGTALSWCVFPFILPDLVKMALAVMLSERVKKYLH